MAGLPSHSSKREGWRASRSLDRNRTRCPPTPTFRRANFVPGALGEGWWSTNPFSTNEGVRNFFYEQRFRVLNRRLLPAKRARRCVGLSFRYLTGKAAATPPP